DLVARVHDSPAYTPFPYTTLFRSKVRDTRPHGCASLAGALQKDDRDLSRGPLLVLPERRHPRRLKVVQTATFGALGHARVRFEPLGPDFDGDAGVRAEIAVPVGICGRTALRRDHENAVAVAGEGQRICPLASCLRPARG